MGTFGFPLPLADITTQGTNTSTGELSLSANSSNMYFRLDSATNDVTLFASNKLAPTVNDGVDVIFSLAYDPVVTSPILIIPVFSTCKFIVGGGGTTGKGGPVTIGDGVFTVVFPITGDAPLVIKGPAPAPAPAVGPLGNTTLANGGVFVVNLTGAPAPAAVPDIGELSIG
jgi:hypothetical protein